MEPQVIDVASTSPDIYFPLPQYSLEGETRKSTCSKKTVSQEDEAWLRFSQESTDALYANICVICGGPEPSYYYGALSCLKCKAHFRKIVKSPPKQLKCKKSGNCPANHRKKRTEGCGSCRFQRCLKAGMKVENVLKTLLEPIERKKQTWEEYLPSLTNQKPLKDLSLDTSDYELAKPEVTPDPIPTPYGSNSNSPSDIQMSELLYGTHDYFVPQYETFREGPSVIQSTTQPRDHNFSARKEGESCSDQPLSSKLHCFCAECNL